jgi:hypothetical protein
LPDLYTFQWPMGAPSLADAAGVLHMPLASFDPGFGVVMIDPARKTYAVRASGGPVGDAAASGQGAGPYSDPQIESFGPPR